MGVVVVGEGQLIGKQREEGRRRGQWDDDDDNDTGRGRTVAAEVFERKESFREGVSENGEDVHALMLIFGDSDGHINCIDGQSCS